MCYNVLHYVKLCVIMCYVLNFVLYCVKLCVMCCVTLCLPILVRGHSQVYKEHTTRGGGKIVCTVEKLLI